ncbi:hypothetical protein PTSG_00880, partial [Salpingoeca rosetta]
MAEPKRSKVVVADDAAEAPQPSSLTTCGGGGDDDDGVNKAHQPAQEKQGQPLLQGKRQHKKKLKKGDQKLADSKAVPTRNPDPAKCDLFLPKKKRFCRLTKFKDYNRCAEHLTEARRIPCPYDPTHTVFEHQKEKHMKKCPRRPRPKPRWWAPGINSSLLCATQEQMGKSTDSNLPSNQQQQQQQQQQGASSCSSTQACGDRGHPDAIRVLGDISTPELQRTLAKLEEAFTAHVPELEMHAEDDPELRRIVNEHALQQHADDTAAFKHLEQHARIVGNMRRHGLVPSSSSSAPSPSGSSGGDKVNGDGSTNDGDGEPTVCFVEFGAGKAKLLHALRLALGWNTPAAYLAVERQSGMKSKADKFLRAKPSPAVKFERITMDINDLDMSKAPLVDGRDVVAASKHLCGCATDLSLRCLLNLEHKMPGSVRGTCIALCCHDKCTWDLYCNQEFFTETLKWTRREFSIIRIVSSWGTLDPDEDIEAMKERRRRKREQAAMAAALHSADNADDDNDDDDGHDHGDGDGAADNAARHNQQLGLDRKQHVKYGQMAKRLIDWGRVLFLRQHGLNATLERFVEASVTPENVLLLAWRMHQHNA